MKNPIILLALLFTFNLQAQNLKTELLPKGMTAAQASSLAQQSKEKTATVETAAKEKRKTFMEEMGAITSKFDGSNKEEVRTNLRRRLNSNQQLNSGLSVVAHNDQSNLKPLISGGTDGGNTTSPEFTEEVIEITDFAYTRTDLDWNGNRAPEFGHNQHTDQNGFHAMGSVSIDRGGNVDGTVRNVCGHFLEIPSDVVSVSIAFQFDYTASVEVYNQVAVRYSSFSENAFIYAINDGRSSFADIIGDRFIANAIYSDEQNVTETDIVSMNNVERILSFNATDLHSRNIMVFFGGQSECEIENNRQFSSANLEFDLKKMVVTYTRRAS